ncbi:MAG TPA: hypothetical protein VGS62_11335, partial [Streptosporangiaceae bacterium]|nr:hypothetical protein [Streptosporangiaceae bacterium]
WRGHGRKHHRWRKTPRLTAIASCASLAGALGVAIAVPGSAAAGQRPPGQQLAAHRATAITTGCQLGNGIKHVVQLTFDNVHFFRDNPNVPSDLQMMPNLLHFIERNGTLRA